MKGKKILYVSSELTPYFPENPISRTSVELPRQMSELGKDVRIFMPCFGNINERRHQLHEVIRLSGMNLVVNDMSQPLVIKVASIPKTRLQVYFIDNDEYFKRKGCYRDKEGNFYTDNDERMLFFVRGVLETIKKLNWSPDVIHVHGWMSALLPLYLRTYYKDEPIFNDTRVFSSVYDVAYEGNLDEAMIKKIEMDGIDISALDYLREPSFLNLTRLMVEHSDGVVKGAESLSSDLIDLLDSADRPVLDYLSCEAFAEAYGKLYEEAALNEA